MFKWRTTSLARRGLAFPLNAIRLSMDTRVSGDLAGPTQQQKQPPPAAVRLTGWGGRDRTYECRNQNPMPYHLATPQLNRVLLSRSTRTADAGRAPAPQYPASVRAAGATRRAPLLPSRTMQTRRPPNRSFAPRRNSPAIRDDARLRGIDWPPRTAG